MVELRFTAPAVGLLLAEVDKVDCAPLLSRTGQALAPVLRTHPTLAPDLVEAVLHTADPVLVRALVDNEPARTIHRDLWQRYAADGDAVVGTAWREHDTAEQATPDDGPGAASSLAPDRDPAEADVPIDTEGTSNLIRELYEFAERHKGQKSVPWRELRPPKAAIQNQREPDWAALRAAQSARRFRPEFVEQLLDRPDCPDEFAVELASILPRGLDLMVASRRPVSATTVRALLRTVVTAETLDTLVTQRLGRDISAADLLTEVRPARTVLKLAWVRTVRPEPGQPKPGPAEQAGWATFRALLGELVTGRLADNAAAWRALRVRLPKFDGSVAELVEEAVAAGTRPAPAGSPDEDWPDAADTPPFFDVPSLHVNRAAFVMLLTTATTDDQWFLLPQLDDRTRYDLLAEGEWRPEWLSRAIADDDQRILVLLSRHLDLATEAIEALATLDDPTVNAALIYQRQASDEQRDKLISGTPFTPGRTGPLPFDPNLRKVLLGTWHPYRLEPLLGSRDAELVTHALGKVGLPQNRVLRVLLERWERYGPDGLVELLPDSVQKGVRTLLTGLVADPDSDDALRRLRDAVYEAESPTRAVRRLRSDSTPKALLAEGFRWDWDLVVREHQENPFSGVVLRRLQTMDDCPPILRTAFPLELGSTEKRAMKALTSGKGPATVLAKTPLHGRRSWAVHAVRMGALAPVDVLEHGRPARAVLDTELADEAYRAELAALVRKHLDARPDAWLLTLALLPDFAGTVPELLRSAALTTAP